MNNGYFYQNTRRFNSAGQSNYYWINDNGLGYTYAVFGLSGLEPTHWNSYLEDMWKEILGENFNRSFFGFAIRCVRTE